MEYCSTSTVSGRLEWKAQTAGPFTKTSDRERPSLYAGWLGDPKGLFADHILSFLSSLTMSGASIQITKSTQFQNPVLLFHRCFPFNTSNREPRLAGRSLFCLVWSQIRGLQGKLPFSIFQLESAAHCTKKPCSFPLSIYFYCHYLSERIIFQERLFP